MKTDVERPRSKTGIVDALKSSALYRDYEKAFSDATGLPLTLRPFETLQLHLADSPKTNSFCTLMATSNRSCAACLQMQQRIVEEAQLEAKTLNCFAGLCDTAVPIRVGEDLIAFLQTGQVLLHRPTKEELSRTTRLLLQWGSDVDLKRLEEAYFQTRVLSVEQYESMVRLLSIFAQHLSALSNQLLTQEHNKEAPPVARARAYIGDHLTEELSLESVARVVNMSAFYFCKVFKKTTGLTFTEYIARLRIEKVKNLLLNPHVRISEAAYEVGFQSLSQFNRVFRKVTGESPSTYRHRMHLGKI